MKVAIPEKLAKQIKSFNPHGDGGWQSLIRRVQAALDRSVLDMEEEVWDRIRAYAMNYGDGGYQSRVLRPLLVARRTAGETDPQADGYFKPG